MVKSYFSFFLILAFAFGFAQETTILDVRIEGVKRIRTSFIKKLISTKPGGVLDSLILNEDVIRLKRLPSVSHANYQTNETKGGLPLK